ncbi:unannotated protein [freshwater metagenome]|uniref:Unannotated protein n=1 Tax=freshwater metagenome TaxID=449393 RepID=A0A6J6NFL6_9ZZZZ
MCAASAIPFKSSIIPRLVVPAVPTIAKTRDVPVECNASISLATSSPCNLRSALVAIFNTSTSMTFAADAMDECDSSEHAITQRVASGNFLRASARATTSADKFPIVPPCTNTPPAESGNPAKSISHCNAWFSANTAPAPSCHEPPYKALAPTTRSNKFANSLGADGINAK